MTGFLMQIAVNVVFYTAWFCLGVKAGRKWEREGR